MTSNFWIYNRNILLDKNEFLKFIPLQEMTKGEKLNAITRCSFYLSIILSILSNNLNYILIFISTLIFTYLYYIFTEPEYPEEPEEPEPEYPEEPEPEYPEEPEPEYPEEPSEDIKDIDLSDVPVDISNLI